MMSNRKQNENPKQEELSDKKKETLSLNKPSRLAERKGQRPAFPFKRKPV